MVDTDLPDLFLDRTILAHPQLFASLLMASRAHGRKCVYDQEDLWNLLWYATGEILGWAFNDEKTTLTRFHREAGDDLRQIIPRTARLDSAWAPIVFLSLAESEGWVEPIWRHDDRQILGSLLASQAGSVLHGLRTWEGTLEEFILEPYVDISRVTAERREQERAFDVLYGLGKDSAKCIPLLETETTWFDSQLYGIFRTWLDSYPGRDRTVQMCGSSFGDVQIGRTTDLDEQVRCSLLSGIAACLDGEADYVTLSNTTTIIAELLGAEGASVRRVISDTDQISQSVANLSNTVTTDSLAFFVDKADVVRALNELFAPSEARQTVGGYVSTFARSRLLPKPLQFLDGIGHLAVRNLKRRRRS